MKLQGRPCSAMAASGFANVWLKSAIAMLAALPMQQGRE
jgi:hypothetical protein